MARPTRGASPSSSRALRYIAAGEDRSLIRAISITAPTGYEMDRAGIDAALGRNKLTRTDPSGIWYLRVDWHHGHADDPVTIYSEVEAGGYEYRKVHRLIDGTLEWADKNHEGDRTGLGKKPVGTVESCNHGRPMSV